MWETVGLEIAKMVGKQLGLKILDILLPDNENNLEEAFSQAVREIDINTRQAILDNELYNTRSDVESVSRLLGFYRNSPTTNLLENATIEANKLFSKCKTLSIVSPPGYGLAGHPFFMIVANLMMGIFQERMKQIDQNEKNNLNLIINESKSHASFMHEMWLVWTERRFTPLIVTPGGGIGHLFSFYYQFDGTIIFTGKTCMGGNQYMVLQTQAAEEGEEIRQKHINDEQEKITKKFVTPSLKIVNEWNKLLLKLNFTTLSEKDIMQRVWSHDFKKLIRPR